MKKIKEILQVEESYGGVAAVYPMLVQRQHLLNLRFAKILQQVARNLIAESPEAIEHMAALIENLSIHIYLFPCGNIADNLEIAITGYQIVLNNRQPGSEKYAQTQNNLAAAYSDRISGSEADNRERAILCYRDALTIRTRGAFPQNHAATLSNLGNLYRSNQQWQLAYNTFAALDTVELSG